MTKKASLAAAMQKSVKGEVKDVKSKNEPQAVVELTKNDLPPSRQGKKAITGFFDPLVSRQLKQIGLEEDKTVQALMTEALNDLFEKYGKNPIA